MLSRSSFGHLGSNLRPRGGVYAAYQMSAALSRCIHNTPTSCSLQMASLTVREAVGGIQQLRGL